MHTKKQPWRFCPHKFHSAGHRATARRQITHLGVQGHTTCTGLGGNVRRRLPYLFGLLLPTGFAGHRPRHDLFPSISFFDGFLRGRENFARSILSPVISFDCPVPAKDETIENKSIFGPKNEIRYCSSCCCCCCTASVVVTRIYT